MHEQDHPLINSPEDHKIDYMSLVASIAAVDGDITDEEISRLRKFCTAIGIGEMGVGMVIMAMENPSVIDIQAIIERLSHTPLRFTLLTDMLCMARSDGMVAPGEEVEIHNIAAKLGVSQEEITALDNEVMASIQKAESIPENAVSTLTGSYAGIRWLFKKLIG